MRFWRISQAMSNVRLRLMSKLKRRITLENQFEVSITQKFHLFKCICQTYNYYEYPLSSCNFVQPLAKFGTDFPSVKPLDEISSSLSILVRENSFQYFTKLLDEWLFQFQMLYIYCQFSVFNSVINYITLSLVIYLYNSKFLSEGFICARLHFIRILQWVQKLKIINIRRVNALVLLSSYICTTLSSPLTYSSPANYQNFTYKMQMSCKQGLAYSAATMKRFLKRISSLPNDFSTHI